MVSVWSFLDCGGPLFGAFARLFLSSNVRVRVGVGQLLLLLQDFPVCCPFVSLSGVQFCQRLVEMTVSVFSFLQ